MPRSLVFVGRTIGLLVDSRLAGRSTRPHTTRQSNGSTSLSRPADQGVARGGDGKFKSKPDAVGGAGGTRIEPAPSDQLLSAACFSTIAALGGSVLVVTSPNLPKAFATPANEINATNTNGALLMITSRFVEQRSIAHKTYPWMTAPADGAFHLYLSTFI